MFTCQAELHATMLQSMDDYGGSISKPCRDAMFWILEVIPTDAMQRQPKASYDAISTPCRGANLWNIEAIPRPAMLRC